jgi:hypothetical protein
MSTNNATLPYVNIINDADTTWVLTSTALVLLMVINALIVIIIKNSKSNYRFLELATIMLQPFGIRIN